MPKEPSPKRGQRKKSSNAIKPQRVVEEAAQGAHRNPQDRSTLRDQRDRTTGADQATRTDMDALTKRRGRTSRS